MAATSLGRSFNSLQASRTSLVAMPSMLASPSISPRSTFTSAPAVPQGRYSDGEALPNNTTCGQPTAAAACAGPESTVTSALARASSATRREIGKSPAALQTPSTCASAASSWFKEYSGAVPKSTMGCAGHRARRNRMTAAQRGDGQYLLLTAKRRSPRRMVRLLPAWINMRGRVRPRPCSHASRSACCDPLTSR